MPSPSSGLTVSSAQVLATCEGILFIARSKHTAGGQEGDSIKPPGESWLRLSCRRTGEPSAPGHDFEVPGVVGIGAPMVVPDVAEAVRSVPLQQHQVGAYVLAEDAV